MENSNNLGINKRDYLGGSNFKLPGFNAIPNIMQEQRPDRYINFKGGYQMKKIGILILALFYCYCFAFSQANNDSIKYPIDISIDTSIIYDDARDYVRQCIRFGVDDISI